MSVLFSSPHKQSGVIPYRRSKRGIEILLITNRSQKRWIVPKGVIEAHLNPQESAVKEAYEEAGIRGKIYSREIGKYRYRKLGKMCTVKVYLFRVKEILDDWPEASFRRRKWLIHKKAVRLVRNRELKEMINSLVFD